MTNGLNHHHRQWGHGPSPTAEDEARSRRRMKWAGRVVWAVLVGLLAAAAVSLVLRPAAEAHSWYDGLCCNESDCRQTTLGEVELHDNGWYVVPTQELIPFGDGRIKRSLDPLIHRCVKPNATTRCLYVPEQGG